MQRLMKAGNNYREQMNLQASHNVNTLDGLRSFGINLVKVSGLNKPKQDIERGNLMGAFSILNFHHMIRGFKQDLQCSHALGEFWMITTIQGEKPRPDKLLLFEANRPWGGGGGGGGRGF